MPVVRTVSQAVFACRSAVCRPPTSGGTGGSVKEGALPNGANPDRHAKQIITEMNAPNGVLGVVPKHAGMIKEAATTLWGRLMPSDPVVRLRVPDDETVLRSILTDGRFKSQHESGESMGYFDPAIREFREKQMFRVKGSRPIYGYLAERALSGKMPTSNPLSAYGPIAFELKPGVLQRSTITIGDSLNSDAAPIRVGDVKTATPERLMAATGLGLRNYMGSMVTQDKMSPKEVGNNLADWNWHDYVETQVHGSVSLSDVARVIIPSDRRDSIALIRSLAPDLEIVVIGNNETFSIRALVAACHSAACRPPTSGGTGGSSPEGSSGDPGARAHVPGKWEKVVRTADDRFDVFLRTIGYGTDPLWKDTPVERMRQTFDAAEKGRSDDSGDTIYVNGPLELHVPSDMNPAAVGRLQSRLDSLYQTYPPAAPRVNVFVNDEGNPAVWGTTMPYNNGDSVTRVTLRRTIVEGEDSISEYVSPGFFQNSNPSVSAAEWTTVHEWGHTTDRRRVTPERPSLFQNGSRPGLSRYGRSLPEEGYAESFADWVTSKGQSTNEATRLYAQYHKWPAP